MRATCVALALCGVVLAGDGWAQAEPGGSVAIGSSLGVTVLTAENQDAVTAIAIPNGNLLVAASPGFRVAHVPARHDFEFGIDLALLFLSSNGSAHDATFGVDLARFFSLESGVNPFLQVDGGIRTFDFGDNGQQAYLGFGLGIRNVIADGHGAVKLGARYRRYFESQSDGLPSLNAFAFELGYDLWIPR